jgi:hypothetical protein
MKIGPLDLTIHRTVRVADGRSPSNLPPSLGRCKIYKVSDYKDRCPENWEPDAVFVGLHDVEALWLSFHTSKPLALLIGAGGVNALTGEKLGTKLVEGGYCVTPPQPWLDGWKSSGDGSVYQFVAQRYEGGKGNTVAEQLIGEESKTGAIGIAVFESKEPLKSKHGPAEGYTGSANSDEFNWKNSSMVYDSAVMSKSLGETHTMCATSPIRSSSMRKGRVSRMSEMGVGKGGKITQKIYPDPYGLDVWKDAPTAVSAIYIVNAKELEEITGDVIPKPVGYENYGGNWFGLEDSTESDVPGSEKFTGLKSAAFPGDVSNVVDTPTTSVDNPISD